MSERKFNPKKSEIYKLVKGKPINTSFKGSKPRYTIPKKYIILTDGEYIFERIKSKYSILSDMTYKEYKKYHNVLISLLNKHVAEDTDGIKIPRLGEIHCKRLFISKEAMIKGLYTNLDSNGKIGKIMWKRTDAIKYNLSLKTHCFSPNVKLKKLVSNAINESPNDYKMAPVMIQNIKQAYPSFEKWVHSGGRQELTRLKKEEENNDQSGGDLPS